MKAIASDGVSWRFLRTGQEWTPGLKWGNLSVHGKELAQSATQGAETYTGAIKED